LEFGSTSYEYSVKIVEDLTARLERPNLDVIEYQSIQEDLKIYQGHKERFEKAKANLGEKGLQAYQLWQLVSGQRFMGMSEVGEIMIPSIVAIFDIYEIEEEDRERMLRWIITVDRLAKEEMRKKKPTVTPPREGVH